jgi:hypothetical protein
MKYTIQGVGIYLNGKLLANAVTPEAARQLVQQLNGPDDYLMRVYNALETNV